MVLNWIPFPPTQSLSAVVSCYKEIRDPSLKFRGQSKKGESNYAVLLSVSTTNN